MPELPDVECYRAALGRRLIGLPLLEVRLINPFLLRSVDPPAEAAAGRDVQAVERLGKRLVLVLEGELFFVLHLMIAGRLRWIGPPASPPARISAAVWRFETGQLVLTEAGTKKRASLHVVQGRAALRGHDPGGVDICECPPDAFAERLRRESHTLKRALTDPRLFSGVGNAYADEILHAARLSPIQSTSKLTDEQAASLHAAAVSVLRTWTARLCQRFTDRFPGPGEVTAFRPEFAVHGKFGRPCPDCGVAVQRIRYAENETNYCPKCQTGGRILADRSLSRLLKNDWPRSIAELP
jgi:formamidopyrimidine-DNA glycosylase